MITVSRGITYSHNKGVAEARERVRDLVAELDPMMVEPASVNHAKPIEACNARLREQGGEDIADHSTDSVGREDLESKSWT